MSDLPHRNVSRIVVLDARQCTLLVRYEHIGSGATGSFWVPPGGAAERGETHRDAARRELREETGLDASIGRQLWQRRFNFQLGQQLVYQIEHYFLVRLASVAPVVHNTSPEAIEEHRWWSLAELRETHDTIYPTGFLTDFEALLREGAA